MSGGRRYGARLTPQEEEIIKVSFESFSEPSERAGDPVGKRYINAEKLTEAFISIHAKGDMQDIQLLLDDIDETGEGIDAEMWRHIMSRKFLGEEDDSSFGHVFAMLDDNKDGYIPLVELRKMLMQEGQAPLSEQEVDELLMFADADSDGLIDYRRFLLWLSHPEAFHKDQADSKTAVAATAATAAQAKAGAKAAPKPKGGIAGIPGGGPKAGALSPKAGAGQPPKAAGFGPAASPKGPMASPKGSPPSSSGVPGGPKAKAPGPSPRPGGPPDNGGGVGDLGGGAAAAEQEKRIDEMERQLVLNGVQSVDRAKARRVLQSNGWKVDDNAMTKYVSS